MGSGHAHSASIRAGRGRLLGYRAFEYWLPVAHVRLLRTLGQCDDNEITQSM